MLEGTTVSISYSLGRVYQRKGTDFFAVYESEQGNLETAGIPGKLCDKQIPYLASGHGICTGDIFFLRSNPETTITGPASAYAPISVGGFNASDDSLYLDSGRGYNIDNQVKPDFLAPAVEVFGPDLTGNFTRRTGTSAAAAVTARAAAQLLEWGSRAWEFQ